MSVLRFLVPQIVVVILTLLASASLGLETAWRLALPLLVAATIFHWNCRRPAIPEWVAFVSGLVIDAATQGPLGYFALLNLLACALAGLLTPRRRPGRSAGPVSAALAFAVATVVLASAAWSIASLYDLARADARPMLLAAAVLMFSYPLLAAGIALVEQAISDGGDRAAEHGGALP